MRGGPNRRDDMHHFPIAAAHTRLYLGFFSIEFLLLFHGEKKVSPQVHPALEGKRQKGMDKRTKCLVFLFLLSGEQKSMVEINSANIKTRENQATTCQLACHSAGIQDNLFPLLLAEV